MYTKEIAMKEINETQDFYVNELIKKITEPNYDVLKYINFTSPTGTGKTRMIAKLMNLLPPPEYYFLITTLSKGQLNTQTQNGLSESCDYEHFIVFGNQDYKVNSRLQANDIISNFPKGSKVIWIRDEGHIATNKWDQLLVEKCFKVINFSATNKHSDIICNFSHTMMLRTINQNVGTPEDAILKLLKVKDVHKCVKHYNPCAIFRCVNDNIRDQVVSLCYKYKLSHIDITDNNSYDMQRLCEDDNEYDVIINKFKIVEGVDIRRAHILYLDNVPKNDATVIQAVGRCRRNALLYRDDIDILGKENKHLLEETRKCFVYYNCKDAEVKTSEDGEFEAELCDIISVQQLKPLTYITVDNGKLFNGLQVRELTGESGRFFISVDERTGFNFVTPTKKPNFYTFNKRSYTGGFAIYTEFSDDRYQYYLIDKENILKLPLRNKKLDSYFDYSLMRIKYFLKDVENYYLVRPSIQGVYVSVVCSDKILQNISEMINKLESRIMTSDNPTKKFSESNYYKIKETTRNYRDGKLRNVLSSDEYDENVIKRLIYYFSDFWWSENHLRNIYRIFYAYTEYSESIYIECFNMIQDFLKNNSVTLHEFDCIEFIYNYFSSINKISEGIITISDSNSSVEIKEKELDVFYNKIQSFDYITTFLLQKIYKFYDLMCDGYTCAYVDCKQLFKHYKRDRDEWDDIPESMRFTYRNNILLQSKALSSFYNSYDVVTNDFESALIGFDTMKKVKDEKEFSWVEDKAVTSKVHKYCKLTSFIENKYSEEIESCEDLLFSGKNNFRFDTRANRCLGWCVEYYSKYLLYGESFLQDFIYEASHPGFGRNLSKQDIEKHKDALIVRACFLCYKHYMKRCYGKKVSKLIRGISTEELIKEKYRDFVNTVITLGKKVYNFVKENLYSCCDLPKPEFDPNLSIDHITALADYITYDTILDVKCTNNIDKKMVKQILAYHYLSTKRSDLKIKRVIIFDAVSGRDVTINIKE